MEVDDGVAAAAGESAPAEPVQPVAPAGGELPTASAAPDGVGASAGQPPTLDGVAVGMVDCVLPGVGLLEVLPGGVLLAGVFAAGEVGADVVACFGGTAPPGLDGTDEPILEETVEGTVEPGLDGVSEPFNTMLELPLL